MIDADLRHWQGVTAHLAKRRQQYAGQLIDNPDTERFHFDRRRMIDSVGREAQPWSTATTVRGSERLADGARNAVATAAAVGAGAVGLGAIVTIAASTAAADVTGLVMASVLAAIGFFVIPAKRKKGKDECGRRSSKCACASAMPSEAQFKKGIARATERIRTSIAPYSRFVRAEGEKLESATSELEMIASELSTLRGRIEGAA